MLKPIVPTERVVVRRRVRALVLGMFCWIGLMGYQLVNLQVFHAEEMRAMAGRQQQSLITLDARRGLLYDRNGRELAMSVEVDSVYAAPAEIEDPSHTAAVLAPALGIKPASIPALAAKLTGDKYFVWLKRKVDPRVRARIEDLSLDGVGFVREHKRFYPHGELAAHVLGWVGMDNKGMNGLELAFDEKIRGEDGKVSALRDARRKLFLKETRREPVPGNSLVLSIDETIQYIAERELRRAVDETGAAAGSAIVMDPASGDILALANEPTFNPNHAGSFPDENRKNRAIVDSYEPGSTFKVITMAAALERGLLRESELFDCQNGSIRVGRTLIRDHKRFEILSASQVLEKSSNVGAIKIGLRLTRGDFYDYIRRFGLGEKTGIDLPAEAKGLVRAPRDWSGLSQASLSFGQEISVTPLQLITAISAVANGGVLQPPRLVIRELGPDGETIAENPPGASRHVLQSGTVAALTRMMTRVVDEGTARDAGVFGYSVAGKTGTAQKIGPEGTYSAYRFVASFVGFVPAARPELAILVVLDEPKGTLFHGGDVAAPVFHRIAEPALRHLGVPPEEQRLLAEEDDGTLVASARAHAWSRPAPPPERVLSEAVPVSGPLPSPASITAGHEVVLPDMQGRSLRKAVSYLSRLGLTTRLEGMSPGEGGLVVLQSPAAGEKLMRGVEVTLWSGSIPAEETAWLDREGKAGEVRRAALYGALAGGTNAAIR